MSILKTALQNLRKSDIQREMSNEEKELKKLFPKMHRIERIELANGYRMLKNIIDTEGEISFNDYLNDISGQKKMKRKNIITEDLKERALQSLSAKVKIAKYHQ